MNRALTLIAILVAAALSLPWTSQAKAQNFYTYVSHSGDDANSCASVANACYTYTTALGKTGEGGIISCVDVGFYGNPTITKSVTIDCLAGGGGINAQFFNINAPGKTVRLR